MQAKLKKSIVYEIVHFALNTIMEIAIFNQFFKCLYLYHCLHTHFISLLIFACLQVAYLCIIPKGLGLTKNEFELFKYKMYFGHKLDRCIQILFAELLFRHEYRYFCENSL